MRDRRCTGLFSFQGPEDRLDRLVKAVRLARALSKAEILALLPGLTDESYEALCARATARHRDIARKRGRRGGLKVVGVPASPYLFLVRDLDWPSDERTAAGGAASSPSSSGQESAAASARSALLHCSIQELYEVHLLEIARICELEGLEYWEVVDELEAAGCELREGDPANLDDDYLHHAYHVRGLRFEEIGQRSGVQPIAVRRRLQASAVPSERRAARRKAA